MLWTLGFAVSQWWPLPALPTGPVLEGRVVIVTGANSGIGLAMAHQLAARSPKKLILACRNQKTGEEALAGIKKKCPAVDAEMWALDLADFESVKRFAARVEGELERVDVAMLNAGMNPGFSRAGKAKLTKDGHEMTHQVNVLGTVLLALLLVPGLRKAPAPRLVFTSSEVHAWGDTGYITDTVKAGGSILDASDDDKYFYEPGRYFLSKTLLQMVVRHLIPALPDIVVVAVNPGGCWTNLGQHFTTPTPAEMLDLAGFLTRLPFFRGAWRGAHLVNSAIWADDSAEYYHLCKPHATMHPFLCTKRGMDASAQYYAEVVRECERVAPGCSRVLGKA